VLFLCCSILTTHTHTHTLCVILMSLFLQHTNSRLLCVISMLFYPNDTHTHYVLSLRHYSYSTHNTLLFILIRRSGHVFHWPCSLNVSVLQEDGPLRAKTCRSAKV
jgi:hypothetical protein